MKDVTLKANAVASDHIILNKRMDRSKCQLCIETFSF